MSTLLNMNERIIIRVALEGIYEILNRCINLIKLSLKWWKIRII